MRDRAKSAETSKVESKHSKGSIKRIHMTNFLTYDDVEIFPDQNLNLIIGPNGSGKSTVVCAICLVFGGSPKILGRSTYLGDYVKHGKDSASVEVEIAGDELASNPIIRMDLRVSNGCHCTFYINNKKQNKEEVVKFSKSYRIQVDNPCQFLAQDKVVEFSKQSPQELLENTEKAAGDVGLFETHQTLKSQSDNGENLKAEIRRLEEGKDRLTAKLVELEPEVKNAEQVKERQTHVANLEMKRPWIEYDTERVASVQLKNELKLADEALDKERESLKPLEETIEKLDAKIARGATALKNQRAIAVSSRNDINACLGRFENASDKMREIESGFVDAQEDAKRKESQIATFQREIGGLRQQLDSISNLENEAELLRANQEKQNALSVKLRTLNNRKNECSQKLDENMAQLRIVDKALTSITSAKNEKILKLKELNPQAYNAYLWFEQNSGKFKGRVYVPVLSISVQNPRQRKFVENVIDKRDWSMFLFEKFEEQEMFMRIMEKEKGWRVACALMDKFTTPIIPNMDEGLKKLGFVDYVSNLFDAPDGLKNFFVDMKGMNDIPVGIVQVEQNLNNVMPKIENRFRMILTENKKLFVKRSKYKNKTSVSDVALTSFKIISDNVDENQSRNLLAAKKNFENEIRKWQTNQSGFEVDEQNSRSEMETLRKEKTDLVNRKTRITAIQAQIHSKEQKMQRITLNMPDIKAMEGEKQEKLLQTYNEKKGFIENCLLKIQSYFDSADSLCIPSLKQFVYIRNSKDLAEQRNELKQNFNESEARLRALNQNYQTKLAEVGNLLRVARMKIGLPSGERQTVLPENFCKIFATLPKTLEEIDLEIDSVHTQLETMKGVDHRALEQYNDAKEELKRFEKRLNDNEVQYDAWKNHFEVGKQKWLDDLQSLITTTSKNFTQFLHKLSCDGLVELNKDDKNDENDFSTYGIHIKVKFRETDEMCQLTHQRQSGGERSLATILYMLSLQDMSHVPFRCVDEINQGMDAENERKVFNLMVEVLSNHSSQYFMLTPKLLPNLEYNDRMRIYIIHNGSYVTPHKQWADLKAMCVRQREMNRTA